MLKAGSKHLSLFFFTSSVLTQNWLCWNKKYVFKDFLRIKLYHLLKPINSNIDQINKTTVSNTCSWKYNLFICIHVIVWFEYTCSVPETILYTQWKFLVWSFQTKFTTIHQVLVRTFAIVLLFIIVSLSLL